jgi:uncharacterized protein (TIGR02996 family)
MANVDPSSTDGRYDSALSQRMDSWKEIAAYLKRDVRTVHRWEQTEGLPIHRHPHQKRGSVYAFKAELDHWWKKSSRDGHIHHTPKPSRVMVAVLPFENLSGNPAEDYFSDGLTEELITRLGGSFPEDLGVIARTSMMGYRRTSKPVKEIGRELGVQYILEGSVRREDESVRITAQLIQVSDQTHLWAESYDRHLTDILSLQSEVARAVTEKIGVKLTPQAQTRLTRQRGADPQAHDAYLRGRFHWHKLSRHHFDTALEYFELARKRDPNYALAYEGIASVWSIRGDNGVVPAREACSKVREALLRGLELDDNLAEIHKELANFRFMYEWDWGGAESEFCRAIELNPNDPDVRLFYADLLISAGRRDEWEAEIRRALELDPFNFFLQCFFGWHLVYLRRYEEAIGQLRNTLESELNFPSAHMGLWGAFYQKGNYEIALKEARAFFASIGDREVAEAVADGHPKTGYEGPMRCAAEILARRSQREYVPSVRVARLYAHAKQEALALEFLEKACEQRETPLVHLNVGWDWDDLRGTTRFQNLLRRTNVPQ